MESVRRLWPLRNLANFSLTIIGLSGFGLLFQSIRNERIFSRSPVITESLKVLSSNESIRNLLGLPIQYNATFSNSYSLGEVDQYYNFQVKGNKSSTSTQLSATKMKVGEINKIINHSVDLSNQVSEKEQQYIKLKQQNKKIKKKDEIAKATQLVNKLSQQLTKLKQQADEAEKKRIQVVSKFYIPQEELYQLIVRNKTPSQVISQEQYLYGIGGLVANLPNRNIICVIPQSENEAKKIYEQKQKYLVTNITQGYLGTRLKQKQRQISQNEIESYGKHKTNLMYGKYSSYRIGFITILMIAGASAMVYFDKFRFRAIGGTFIAREAENFLFSHPKFRSILNEAKNKKNIKNVKLSNLFQGGRNGDKFRTSVNIQGVKGVRIHFEGIVAKNDTVTFKKFVLEEQNGNKTDLIV